MQQKDKVDSVKILLLFLIMELGIRLKKVPSYFGITCKNWTREMTYQFFVAVIGEVALFAFMKSPKLAIIFGDSSLRLINFNDFIETTCIF